MPLQKIKSLPLFSFTAIMKFVDLFLAMVQGPIQPPPKKKKN